MKNKREIKEYFTDNLRGLEIEAEPHSRDTSSFRRLVNFDLYTPGSIRKAISYQELAPGVVYPSQIRAIRSFRRVPSDSPIVYGFSQTGSVYDLESGNSIKTIGGTLSRPFVAVMPGIINDERVNNLIVIASDGNIYSWDGSTAIGTEHTFLKLTIPTALLPLRNRLSLRCIFSSADVTKGTAINIARKYRVTYYNPRTRHDLALSEDDLSQTTVKSVLRADMVPTDALYVSCVVLTVIGPALDVYNLGYTHMRLWASRDGSDEFFLVRNLICRMPTIGVWQHANTTTGAVVVNNLEPHYFYDGNCNSADPDIIQTAMPSVVAGANLPGPLAGDLNDIYQDQYLVEPAPDPRENMPPPTAIWGAVYQNRLWLVDKSMPSRLVFSLVGDFRSFPEDNYIIIPGDNYDPITALESEYNRLIIGKRHSTYQLVGTNFTDFVITPLDPQVGIISNRAVVRAEGSMLVMSQQGIVMWAGEAPKPYGAVIRPYTDSVVNDASGREVLGAIHSRYGIAIMAVMHNDLTSDLQGPELILMDLSQESPFSIYFPGFGTDISAIDEVELSNGKYEVLVATGRIGAAPFPSAVYMLFHDSPDYEITSWAETQLIPKAVGRRHVFRRMYVKGQGIEEFLYAISTDEGVTFEDDQPLRENNFIGITARHIVVRFTHAGGLDPGTVYADMMSQRPTISNIRIEYEDIGEAL